MAELILPSSPWTTLVPVMVTTVPDAPLVGPKPVIFGITRNWVLLVSVPLGAVTVTQPVVAPLGTVALISLLDTTENVAVVPLKLTPPAPVIGEADCRVLNATVGLIPRNRRHANDLWVSLTPPLPSRLS